MTLILSAGNEDYVVLAADQRLTRADAAGNLSLFDSKSNKMTLLTTRDAQVAVAYTGLASVNIPPGHSGPPPPRGFSTPYWIVDTLSRCAEPDRLLEPTLERLRDAAEAEFTRQALRVKDAPLEIVIAGYRYVDPSSLERFLIRHKLSNVEGTTSSGNGPFVISDPNEGTGASFVMSAGTVTALEDSDVSFLRETVDTPGFAPGATIDRLAHTIRLVAGRPASKSAIG